ncbi:MAG: 3-isopropylmalate dehydratase small subunit [Desulfatiglandaceae bacterium]
MKIEGRVWKFGDHVDTDLIIPARYLYTSDGHELAKYCFVDIRPEFVQGIRPGDIVVAGVNFGCGSSREQAPLAMKALGVGAVIAKHFSRIFYRNAFNIGLPILESETAVEAFSEGSTISVDMETGEMKTRDQETGVFAKPIPDFMREIVRAGGLVAYIKREGSF